MTVGHMKGETRDLEGVLWVSKYHETVVYEDRGQDLGFLLTPSVDIGTSLSAPTGGPEYEQLWVTPEGGTQTALISDTLTLPKAAKTAMSRLFMLLSTHVPEPQRHHPPPRQKSEPPCTLQKKGSAFPTPTLRPARGPEDHTMNALIEFAALTEASLKDKTEACAEIMNLYRRSTLGMPISEKLLRERLEAAGAVEYDTVKCKVLVGEMTGSYMIAYSASGGFLPTEEGSGGGLQCTATQNDPLVVLAECTRVMLEDRTLATARRVAGRLLDGLDPVHWCSVHMFRMHMCMMIMEYCDDGGGSSVPPELTVL
ncbi:hypothetical protein ACJJTC_013036 [Scirpophaga incertulas]